MKWISQQMLCHVWFSPRWCSVTMTQWHNFMVRTHITIHHVQHHTERLISCPANSDCTMQGSLMTWVSRTHSDFKYPDEHKAKQFYAAPVARVPFMGAMDGRCLLKSWDICHCRALQAQQCLHGAPPPQSVDSGYISFGFKIGDFQCCWLGMIHSTILSPILPNASNKPDLTHIHKLNRKLWPNSDKR